MKTDQKQAHFLTLELLPSLARTQQVLGATEKGKTEQLHYRNNPKLASAFPSQATPNLTSPAAAGRRETPGRRPSD